MKAAHLAPNGTIEPLTQPFRIGGIGLQLDRSNFIERPIALQLKRAIGSNPHEMCGRNTEDVPVDGAGMIGVIEHEEIGDFFLAELSLDGVERKQSVGHRGEGKRMLVSVPHQNIQAEMVACENQRPFPAVPYGNRERSA